MLLGRPLGLLGLPEGVPGGLVGVPGVLLVALRGFIHFWVALGAVSGKIREILGSQNGAQIDKGPIPKWINFVDRVELKLVEY